MFFFLYNYLSPPSFVLVTNVKSISSSLQPNQTEMLQNSRLRTRPCGTVFNASLQCDEELLTSILLVQFSRQLLIHQHSIQCILNQLANQNVMGYFAKCFVRYIMSVIVPQSTRKSKQPKIHTVPLPFLFLSFLFLFYTSSSSSSWQNCVYFQYYLHHFN